MKIMQVVYPGLGGTSSVAFSIVEGQNKKKEKNFFLFYGIEKLINQYQHKCSNLNIKFTYIKKKQYEIKFKKIYNIILKNNPDVIVVHDYNILPFFISKLLLKKKLIFVHHTPDKTKKLIGWILYFFNSILSDTIVLVSKRNKSDFMYKLNRIFFSNKLKIIENGINTEKFRK